MALISATFCLLDVGLNPSFFFIYIYIYIYILFKKKTQAILKKPTFTTCNLSLNGIDII